MAGLIGAAYEKAVGNRAAVFAQEFFLAFNKQHNIGIYA